MGFGCARSVTKHGGICPSLAGVNWVSDGAGIDFVEMYAYQKCLLLYRVVNSSRLLRKKQSNSMRSKCLGLAIRQALQVDTEIFWTL